MTINNHYIRYIQTVFHETVTVDTLICDKILPQIYPSVDFKSHDRIVSKVTFADLKHNALLQLVEMKELCQLFRNKNIDVVFFKGITLSMMLYDNYYSRMSGDIDIYAENKIFPDVIKLMKAHGYTMEPLSDAEKYHHVVLHKSGGNKIELHRSFINSTKNLNTELLNGLCYLNINGVEYPTLDTQSYFIYMLYHIYMHVSDYINADMQLLFTENRCLDWNVYIRDKIRDIYEFVLFFEKYRNDIDLNYIIEELGQIPYVMWLILQETNNIFPDILPQQLLDIKYTDDINQKFIINVGNCDIKSLISSNIQKYHYGESAYLSNDFCYRKEISNTYSGLLYDDTQRNAKLNGTVSVCAGINDIVFSYKTDIVDPIVSFVDCGDAYSCDCVGLMLAQTEPIYNLKYLFAYPVELQSGNLGLKIYSINPDGNMVVSENCGIIGDIASDTNGTYITIRISRNILSEDNIYCDFILTKCNHTTHRREIALSAFCDRYSYGDIRRYLRLSIF